MSLTTAHDQQLVSGQSHLDLNGVPTLPVLIEGRIFGDERPSKRPRLHERYECKDCGKSYSEKKSLTRHQKTPAHGRRAHLAVPDYVCEDCGRQYARQDNLHRHVEEVHHQHKRRNTRVVNHAEPPAQFSLLRATLDGYGYLPSHSSEGDAHSDEAVDMQSWGSSSGTGMYDATSSFGTSPGAYSSASSLTASEWCPVNTDLFDYVGHGIATEPLWQSRRRASVPAILPTPMPDTITGTSASATASICSTLDAVLPDRSALNPRQWSRNPRMKPMRFPEPCPLCREELHVPNDSHGNDVQNVKKHMDRHLAKIARTELIEGPQLLSCSTCQVDFSQANDLEWHEKCVATHSTCGYAFEHLVPCTGHHPPSNMHTEQQDHQGFQRRVQEWSTAQLTDFADYLQRYAEGDVPTNAPSYGTSRARFRRSTGSLFSARSQMTTISLPVRTKLDGTPGKQRPVDSPLRKLARAVAEAAGSPEANLTRSVEQRDLGNTEKLLAKLTEHGFDLTQMSKISIDNDDLEMLQLLLQASGAKGTVNVSQLLCHSVKRGCTSITTMLIRLALSNSAGCQDHVDRSLEDALQSLELVDQPPGADGESLLFLALRAGRTETVRILLQHGVNLDAEFDHGRELVFTALQAKKFDIAELLLKHGASFDQCSEALLAASAEGDATAIDLCLRHGASIEARDSAGRTPLILAAKTTSHAVEVLLSHHADVHATDAAGDTALHHAAKDNKQDLIEILLHHDSDVHATDREGNTALHLATRYKKNEKIIKMLLQRGSDVRATDKTGDTPLHHAARFSKNKEAIELLLSDRADVNAICHATWTPLHVAAHHDKAEAIEVLLQHGADINARTDDGSTALHILAARNSLQHDADVNTRLNDKTSALDAIEVLLRCGANVNATDREGRTALHIAAATRGYEPAIEVLLWYGGDAHALDDNNQPALPRALWDMYPKYV